MGVFALGKQWQFRNWRWNKPSTLFDHGACARWRGVGCGCGRDEEDGCSSSTPSPWVTAVPGFFLMDAALKPPEEVRSWNVTMLPVRAAATSPPPWWTLGCR